MDEKIKLAQTVKDYEHDTAVLPYAIELAELVLAETPMRYALVKVDVGKVEQIKAYMPGNYEVVGRTAIGGTNTVSVLIAGRDVAGWTLEDYVIPRLASGLYFAEVVE